MTTDYPRTCLCYEVDDDPTSLRYTAHSLETLRPFLQEEQQQRVRASDVFVLTPQELAQKDADRLSAALPGVVIVNARDWLEEARVRGCVLNPSNPAEQARWDVLTLRLLAPLMDCFKGYDALYHLDGDTEVVDGRFLGLVDWLDGDRDIAGVCERDVAAARFQRALRMKPIIPPYPALWNVAAGNYLNAGVYCWDLRRARRTDGWLRTYDLCRVARESGSRLPDQDALNLMLSVIPAPNAYNAFAETGWREGDAAYVRHYPGSHKDALNRRLCVRID